MDPIEDIIEKLHVKYQVPKMAIRAIVDSPFRCMTDSWREKEMKNFLFINFGRFCVSKLKHKKLLNAKLKREREQNEQDSRDPGWVEEQPNQGTRD